MLYAHAHSIKYSLIEALWHGQTAVYYIKRYPVFFRNQKKI